MKKLLRNVGLLMASVAFLSVSSVLAVDPPRTGGENKGSLGSGMAFKTKFGKGDVGKSGAPRAAMADGAEDEYSIVTFPVALPIAGDPAFAARASAIAEEIYNTGRTTASLGYRLRTEDISRQTGGSDDVAWLAGKITAKPGKKIRINRFDFSQDSSDGTHALTNRYSLIGGTYSFTPYIIGRIRGVDGQPDQKITSGDDRDVDEICFVLFQGKYFVYQDAAGYTGVNNWVTGQDLSVYYALDIVNADGTVVGRGVTKLQLNGTPMVPTLSIALTGGSAVMNFGLEPGRTAVVESTNDLVTWRTEATVNSGDRISRTPTSQFVGIRVRN